MAKMAEQLGQMQQQMNEMEMLDAAMDQLEMAKDAMACEECEGEGCEACMGSMANMDQFSTKCPVANEQRHGRRSPGPAPVRGPTRRNATNTARHARASGSRSKAPPTFAGMVEGPNVKGDVAQAIKEEMATLEAEPADPLTSERLPNSRREHAEEYFQHPPRREVRTRQVALRLVVSILPLPNSI